MAPSTAATAAAAADEAPWKPIAEQKQRDRASRIPSKWHIPASSLPKDPPTLADGPQNVLHLPRQFLTHAEIEITEGYTVETLVSAITQKKLTSVAVADAFCHRAAIAQQLTNCLTEPLFREAAARAKFLDDYLSTHGQPFGPLHGLPVSVKDTFDVQGVDTSIGLAYLCNKPAQRNAPLVDLLLSLGCVVVAKTNIPQTLASLDSVNNIFGRTMNPINRLCTAGGSSGGEGVLVAMKGSMLGIGTDIGGSIRVPAMCNGVYGFKPSNLRLPYGGQALTGAEGMSRTSVQAVAGPIARSVRDVDFFLAHVMPLATAWGEDCMPCTWTLPSVQPATHIKGSGPNGELVIGILRSDGNCTLLPPITRVLNEVAVALAGRRVIVKELLTPPAWTKAQSVMSKLMGVDGATVMHQMITDFKEPLVPWMASRFRAGKAQPLERVAELQAQRSALERDMLALWSEVDEFGRRRPVLDAIVCPVAPHPVPPIEGYNAVGMTSSFVLFDYPAGTVPVRNVVADDLELGRPLAAGNILSSWDVRCRELWDEHVTDRRVYLGTPLSVQVVTQRGRDEWLCRVMGVIDEAVKAEIAASATAAAATVKPRL
ncbi:Acetamidase [Cladophialophora carrionii]|uniref:amidase n=1 Tax=Cladophialophora carrionii TaxID=86049 RepID=A0A1C1CMG1_9EURO|nr:Acetamidase [Cladophialophora carrionii]